MITLDDIINKLDVYAPYKGRWIHRSSKQIVCCHKSDETWTHMMIVDSLRVICGLVSVLALLKKTPNHEDLLILNS